MKISQEFGVPCPKVVVLNEYNGLVLPNIKLKLMENGELRIKNVELRIRG